MSTSNVDPSNFLGGTWEAIKDRMLIGAGGSYASTSTGGSTTHTLSIAEMPSHTHTFTTGQSYWGQDWYSGGGANNAFSCASSKQAKFTLGGTTDATGGSQSFNIMNPYYAVYMWRRTN